VLGGCGNIYSFTAPRRGSVSSFSLDQVSVTSSNYRLVPQYLVRLIVCDALKVSKVPIELALIGLEVGLGQLLGSTLGVRLKLGAVLIEQPLVLELRRLIALGLVVVNVIVLLIGSAFSIGRSRCRCRGGCSDCAREIDQRLDRDGSLLRLTDNLHLGEQEAIRPTSSSDGRSSSTHNHCFR